MSTSPCIYCRREDVPRTREHVLQATFGAVATLPDQVCGDCNSAFSAIDKYFSEIVGFWHLGTHVFRMLGIGRAQLEDGSTLAVRLRPDGLGEFLPQYREVDPTTWQFIGSSEEDHQKMLAELGEPSRLEVSSRLYSSESGASELSVVRSRPWKYLVQGTDGDRVAKFCELLKASGFRPDWIGEPRTNSEHSGTGPAIKYDTAIQLAPLSRAMAKVALNFICYRLGPVVALNPEFDALRDFARLGIGNWFDFVLPTLLNHEIEQAVSGYVLAPHHGLWLFQAGPGEGGKASVFIALQGKTVGRVDVRKISAPEGLLPIGDGLLTKFDPIAKTLEDFELPRDLIRAMVNPSAFGPEMETYYKFLTGPSSGPRSDE